MINVLIVDDDAMVAEIKTAVMSRNSPVFTAAAQPPRWRKQKEIIFHSGHHIDLILLDIYMQKENGLDLLPVLHSEGCKCDVIVISSAADATTIKDSLHYGVVDYLDQTFPGFPV